MILSQQDVEKYIKLTSKGAAYSYIHVYRS